jgi:hypothetical protein
MPEPVNTLDPRIHAFRPDLADLALRDIVAAARYVEPVIRQCIRGVVPLLSSPREDSRLVSQIRYGEFLDVFEEEVNGFTWVQSRTDRYVGYIPSSNVLSEHIADLSKRINVLRTFVYPEPSIKVPPVDELTFGSYVGLIGSEGQFHQLASGGFVFARHVIPAVPSMTADYVFTAGRLLKVPYLWGGRTPQGIDCSGLVQLSLEIAGYECPRDSDQQREVFGRPLPVHWRDMPWKRGDLVFFDGHVGIMTNSTSIIHASGHDMEVVVEPLFDVVMRGTEILAMGRPES